MSQQGGRILEFDGNSAPASSRISSFRRAATAPRSPRNKLGRSCSGTFNRTRASILSLSSIDMRSTEMASSKSVHCAICLCEARIVFKDEICACNVIQTQHLPRSSTHTIRRAEFRLLRCGWMDGWMDFWVNPQTNLRLLLSLQYMVGFHGHIWFWYRIKVVA